MPPPLLAGFADRRISTPRGPIRARVGGAGPPLLLLHGYPETHLMWHAVAPRLARKVAGPVRAVEGDSPFLVETRLSRSARISRRS